MAEGWEESSCRSLEKSRGETHRVVLGRMAVMQHAVETQRVEWVGMAANGTVVVEDARGWTLDESCHCHLLQSAVKNVYVGLLGRLDRAAVRSVALPPERGLTHLDLRLP